MSAPAIEARGLWRRFGRRAALADLDLRVEGGSVTGLLGANGAGKTTLLRLVAGLLLPSAGELLVGGVAPDRGDPAQRPRLGFAAEQARLYPELRVAGFLRFAAGARGLRGAEARHAVEEALERFGLEGVARRTLGRCSQGMQQRAALAQACLGDPPLLLVDEPTAGLDPLQRDAVHAQLAERSHPRTLLLCTHDLDEARALCDRVVVLREGRCVAAGSPSQLLGGDALALFADGRDEATA